MGKIAIRVKKNSEGDDHEIAILSLRAHGNGSYSNQKKWIINDSLTVSKKIEIVHRTIVSFYRENYLLTGNCPGCSGNKLKAEEIEDEEVRGGPSRLWLRLEV